MGESTIWPTPVHCPSRNDGRRWIEDDDDLGPMGHSNKVHNTGQEIKADFWAWVETTLEVLRGKTTIAPLSLPHPDDTARQMNLGLIDPTTATLVIGQAQRARRHSSAAYIGLVTQQPHTQWRGITGFYLPWCPACEPTGNHTFKDLQTRLPTYNVRLEWVGNLHPALLPQPGWFDGIDDDRLAQGAIINVQTQLSAFWRRDSEGTTDTHTSALIATAPPVLDTSSLVIVDDLDRDTPVLRHLTGNNGHWSIRTGTPEALQQLADINSPTQPRTAVATHPAAIPPTWGAWINPSSGTVHGPVPNLRAALRPSFPVPHQRGQVTIKIAHLPAGRAVRLSDIQALTPALSAGAEPRVIS